jgi:hypothetical protein
MSLSIRLVAAAIAIAVVAVGGTILLRPGGTQSIGTSSPSLAASAAPASAAPSNLVLPTAGAQLDYSTLPGRILMEHLGNAPDFTEVSTDYHPERRRLYWMQPMNMAGRSAQEFLKGQPAAGKVAADISRDQKKVVFQDPGNGSGEFIWIANLDGTGLAKIATTCSASRAACGDWDPAFDPTGTKVVFVRAQADTTILEIKDLATGTERKLLSTEGPSNNDVAEQPSWSPDGTKIAFGRIHWSAPGSNVPQKGTISVVDVATDRTTVLPIPLTLPGDPHWARDGSRLLFIDGPLTTAGVPFDARPNTGDIYTSAINGTDVKQLTHTKQNIAADWTPDGRHILFFSNYFWLMDPDGTNALPVNAHGDDLSETANGFGYVGHWIDGP